MVHLLDKCHFVWYACDMDTNERFDKFVVADGDCLRWIGGVTKPGPRCAGGYGQFGVKREGKHTHVYAHRYAYERHKGSIPKGLQIRHSCNNRWCVNPAHLSVGTRQDNMNDMKVAGRQSKGINRPLSKLTEAQVLEIRRRYAAGERGCDIKKDYNVSQCVMSRVVNRLTWKHI